MMRTTKQAGLVFFSEIIERKEVSVISRSAESYLFFVK
jgi:hypothetical protein